MMKCEIGMSSVNLLVLCMQVAGELSCHEHRVVCSDTRSHIFAY